MLALNNSKYREDLITKEKKLCLKMLKLVVRTKTDFQGRDVTLTNLKPYIKMLMKLFEKPSIMSPIVKD